MQNVGLYQILYLCLAVALEILANIFLKISNGFKRPLLGSVAIAAILASFVCLAQSVAGDNGFELPIAYAVWGALGIIITSTAGWLMFKQRLNYKGFIGLALLITGMLILKFAN